MSNFFEGQLINFKYRIANVVTEHTCYITKVDSKIITCFDFGIARQKSFIILGIFDDCLIDARDYKAVQIEELPEYIRSNLQIITNSFHDEGYITYTDELLIIALKPLCQKEYVLKEKIEHVRQPMHDGCMIHIGGQRDGQFNIQIDSGHVNLMAWNGQTRDMTIGDLKNAVDELIARNT